jgi:hypothetical protein
MSKGLTTILLVTTIFLSLCLAGCGGDNIQAKNAPTSLPIPAANVQPKAVSTAQPVQTPQPTATTTGKSSVPYGQNFTIIQRNIYVGQITLAEIKDYFTITIKVVSGNGKKVAMEDIGDFTTWGLSTSTTDPQIKYTFHSLTTDTQKGIQFSSNYPNSYTLTVASLDGNGKLLSESLPLITAGYLPPKTDLIMGARLPEPSECKGFELKLRYNPPK